MGFLSKIKEKRSSDISALSSPAQWLIDMFSGPSKSGISVTEETAMAYSAVYACVRILSETVASLPLDVYERLERGKRKARNHYLYYLLHNKPNEVMTSFTWREVMMAHLALWGNHYSEINIDNSGKITSLWPLHPGRVQPVLKNRKLYYIYYDEYGNRIVYAPEEILHIPGLGFDGLVGKSVIRMAREAIGLGLAAEEFGARFFSNGAHPGGIVEYPEGLSDEARERLKRSLVEKYSGLGKSHNIMVFEQGLKYHQVGIPPDDAQFLETRQFQVREIARIFRVPLHMLADMEKGASYSSIEQQAIDFVVHTIRPWLVRIEQVLNDKLISSKNKKNYFIEFNVEGLLRGDSQARAEYYNRMFQVGAMSPNDILEKENMNPMGPEGDRKYVPLNMIPIEEDNPKADDNNRSKSRTESRYLRAKRSAQARRNLALAYERIIKKSAEKVVKKEVKQVRDEAKKELDERNAANFERWLEEFYNEFPETIQKEMAPVIYAFAEAIAEEAGKEIDIDDIQGLDEFIKNYIESFSIRYSRYSRNQLKALIEEAIENGEEPLEKIEERLNEWEERRPGKVAKEESIKGAGAFSKFVFAVGGVTQLIWVTMGSDPCPYCQELNGKVVGIEQNFLGAGDSLDPDNADKPMQVSGNIGHPPLHEGCECGISPA